MSTKTEPVAESAEDLAKRFAELVARCHQDNRHSSKIKTTLEHPAFQEIVSMGEKAVPLLLANLEKKEYSRWISTMALRKITGAGPTIPDESRGRLEQIIALWIAWGREQDYRW